MEMNGNYYIIIDKCTVYKATFNVIKVCFFKYNFCTISANLNFVYHSQTHCLFLLIVEVFFNYAINNLYIYIN